MEARTPVSEMRYPAVGMAWYAAIIAGGLLATALVYLTHDGTDSFVLVLEILGAVLLVVGVLAPAVVGVVLHKLGDHAVGMTVSALIMLGHVMILSGPFFLAAPFVARYLAVQRHNSGGY